MQIAIPTVPDEIIRLRCLELATEYAETDEQAITIAMVFQEYIENGCAGMCQACLKEINGKG